MALSSVSVVCSSLLLRQACRLLSALRALRLACSPPCVLSALRPYRFGSVHMREASHAVASYAAASLPTFLLVEVCHRTCRARGGMGQLLYCYARSCTQRKVLFFLGAWLQSLGLGREATLQDINSAISPRPPCCCLQALQAPQAGHEGMHCAERMIRTPQQHSAEASFTGVISC
jgi:hypothetical protein